MQGWARVAELTKAKNRKGGFVAQCAPNLPFLLAEGMEVRFVPPRLDAPRVGRVTCVEMIDELRAYVLFDTIEDLTTAEMLVGCSILAREDELSLGDYLDGSAIEGFHVIDSKYGTIGTVRELQRNPAHPLLVVETLDGEVLIPYIEEFVISLDVESRVITTAVPDGLLEL